MNTIEVLNDVRKCHADKVFLTDTISGRTLTYAQIHAESCAVAAYLASLGVGRGDRVAVIMDNSVALAKLYFACLYLGAAVAPINPIMSKPQVTFVALNSRAKLIIYSAHLANGVDREALAGKGLTCLAVAEPGRGHADPSGADKIANLDELPAAPGFEPFKGVSEDDDLIIVYTSGTTSDPKGVVHRIRSLFGNAKMFTETLGIGPENVFYNLLSMTYLGGYYNLMMLPYVAGSSVVLSRAFSAQMILNFWEPVIKHKVNTLWVVPTIMSMLLEMDRTDAGAAYCKDNVRLTLVGTAPLPAALKKSFEERYHLRLMENFALSETLFLTSNLPSDPTTEGVGGLLPGIELKFVERKLHDDTHGRKGEIWIRTPYLMRGYYNTETGQPDIALDDGWFATGDIGTLDAKGHLAITGRSKDLIIRGGINISPSSVEKVICRTPRVLECAVVGIPHKIMGEDVAAVVRVAEDADFDVVKAELTTLCRAELSKVQQPSLFLKLDEFPRTSSGKVQKAKIRAWLDALLKQADGGDIHLKWKNIHTKHREIHYQPSKVVAHATQAMSIKYNCMVYDMKRRGEDVIVLSLGEAFFDIPLYPFDDLPFPELYHYSHSRGVPELRENLSKYFLDQYDVAFDPESEIIVTAGSKIAIYMALMAILDPGDEVIIHEPAWVSYPEQFQLCYGVPVHVPYNCDVYDFEDYITSKTKAIIINSPNNPTGRVFTLEELSHLYRLAEKYNLFILSDEAYSDFLLDEDEFISIGNLDRAKKHLILVNSISKNYGISGWRLGYVISNSEMINQILKVNQHLITCPATILEHYISKHFFDIIRITKPQINALIEKRKNLCKVMDDMGLRYLPGTATFYFFVSIEGSSLGSEAFCNKLLQEHHVATVPGIGYGKSCDRFIRVSVGAENMARTIRGLELIKQLIEER